MLRKRFFHNINTTNPSRSKSRGFAYLENLLCQSCRLFVLSVNKRLPCSLIFRFFAGWSARRLGFSVRWVLDYLINLVLLPVCYSFHNSVHLSVRRSFVRFIRVSVGLHVCLFVRPAISLYISSFVCLSVGRSVSICLSFGLSVYPSVCTCVCLSVRPSVCISVRLSVCLSVGRSVSICQSVRPPFPPLFRFFFHTFVASYFVQLFYLSCYLR